MKKYDNKIIKFDNYFDEIAQLTLCAAIMLVIINIFMRVFFSKPIIGTYEYVGFLSSLIVGLSLANSAIHDSNISVEFFYQKLPYSVQKVSDCIMGIIAFLFFLFVTWHMGRYAYSMILSGEVSPSTGTPIYIFIYIVTFGILMLCFAILYKTFLSLRQVR